MRLTEFLQLFFPSDNEPIWLFGYDPKELPDELKRDADKIRITRTMLRNDRNLQNRLKRINETRGLYFTVNSGGTKKHEINRINAVFCEIDDLPIAEQHTLLDDSDLPPSVRVETKRSVHAYWLLEDNCSIDDFITIQRGLIDRFKSDKAIKNQNRVMRLPYFNHISFEHGEYLYKQVQIIRCNKSRYLSAELKGYFPAPKEPEFIPPRFEGVSESDWQEVFQKVRERVRSLPGYSVEHGGRLASARGVCHNGDTNRTLVENLETGKVFCRAECSYEDIMRALGVERPKKKYTIPRVSAPVQTSELYQWLQQAEAV